MTEQQAAAVSAQEIIDALNVRPDVKAQFVREALAATAASPELTLGLFGIPEIRVLNKRVTQAEFLSIMRQVTEHFLAN